jgi:hypothetical protein
MEIAENIKRVRERIHKACQRAGRDPREVTLVAVTKTVAVASIREALEGGIRDFGENYVQEALPKISALGPGTRWHFIGHLQRNKVKYVLGRFHLIHSLDRLSLAQEIQRRASPNEPAKVLLQVNLSGESTKSGVPLEAVEELLEGVCGLSRLRIVGLMTMPPFFSDPEMSRPFFRSLRELMERLRPQLPPPHDLRELSMGMSQDFEVAIEEGATIVRLGTAIFGPRPST